MIERPVIRYHGGKFRLAPKLIEIFPPHRIYTEAFGGGGSVLLLKPRSYAEIYNDLDGEVVNVFRVLQNRRQAKALEAALRLTPYARQEFLLSYKQGRTDVERARRTIIRSFMGFGSDSISRMKASRAGFNTRLSSVMSTGFRWNANQSGTTPAADWAGYPSNVAHFCERLQGVVIEQRAAGEVIGKMDSIETLHYVDPPYPGSSRRVGNGTTPDHGYRHEMTAHKDHEELAELLRSLSGMVIVSSYPSELYTRIYAGWRTISWTSGQFCSANSGAQKRTEMVWLNDQAWQAMPQRLFDLAPSTSTPAPAEAEVA